MTTLVISEPPVAAATPVPTERVIRGSAALIAGNFATKLAGVATVVVAARMLSTADFGAFSFATSFAAILVMFADLGIDLVTTRELAARRRPDGEVLAASLVVKVGLVLLVLAIGYPSLLAFDAPLRPAAAIVGLSVVTAIPGTLALALSARLRMAPVAVLQTSGAVLMCVASVVLLASGHGVVALMVAQLAGAAFTAVALALVAYRVFPYRLALRRDAVVSMARAAAPLTLTLTAVAVTLRADQMLLTRLSDAEQLARYAAAVRLVEALNLAVTALAGIALPVFAAEGVGRLGIGIRYVAALILPLGVLATLYGGVLTRGVYGAAYASAGSSLAVLVWAHYFGTVLLLWQQALIAENRLRLIGLIAVISAVSNVALNLVLIPHHGALGAAVASLISYGLPLVVAPLSSALRPLLAGALRATVKPALATAALFAVLLPFGTRLALVSPLVAAGAVLASRSVTPREIRVLARAALRRA